MAEYSGTGGMAMTQPIRIQDLPTTIDGIKGVFLIAYEGVWAVGIAKIADLGSSTPVLVDLYVHPTRRGGRLGSELVRRAIDLVGATGKPLAAYHLPDSPARSILYREGFKDTGARGIVGMSDSYIWVENDCLPAPEARTEGEQ